MVVWLGVAEVVEADAVGDVAAGNEALGAVDEEGAAAVVGVPAVAVDGVVGRWGADVR